MALSVSEKTGAILVDADKCVGCGNCIDACPGRVPFLHPVTRKAIICDLCDGDPLCSKVCQEARYNALWTVKRPPGPSYKLYAKIPEKVTEELARRVYKNLAERLI
jgi:Fe-S-cluster-containing dehydrogenase component